MLWDYFWLSEILLARICFCWSKQESCQKCLGGWGHCGRLGAKGSFHPHLPPRNLMCVFLSSRSKVSRIWLRIFSQYIIYASFPKLYAWILFCQRHNSFHLVSQILYSINLCLKWRVSQFFRCASISRSYSGKSVSKSGQLEPSSKSFQSATVSSSQQLHPFELNCIQLNSAESSWTQLNPAELSWIQLSS